MSNKLFWVVILAVVLVGCAPPAPDPEKQARADAITRSSIQAAADAEARRQQALLDKQSARLGQEQARYQMSVILPIALVIVAVSFGIAIILAAVGLVLYARRRAVRPVYLQPLGHGQYLLTDSMTGEAKLLDARSGALRQELLTVLPEGAISDLSPLSKGF